MGYRAASRADGELDAMSIEAATQTHPTAGVVPAASWRIRALTVLPNYRLALTFNDGTHGIVDLSALQTTQDCGMYEPLKDRSLFPQAYLEMGAVTWPNGADLDPAWLHDELANAETWSVPI